MKEEIKAYTYLYNENGDDIDMLEYFNFVEGYINEGDNIFIQLENDLREFKGLYKIFKIQKNLFVTIGSYKPQICYEYHAKLVMKNREYQNMISDMAKNANN